MDNKKIKKSELTLTLYSKQKLNKLNLIDEGLKTCEKKFR
ncbi:hypothetical protein SAMN05660206_11461 [Sphingobacterium wenxiniae]|uniref:Uncharacterized protein n=1 Tax=Sphingobacterium wenxiniae TaxID=683125 RepID=A0A1I6VJJ5_9SPHI|nr:hypothetical protein SAMN05660206_11461 [Sphingobacterium wenxiniae]